LLDCLWPVALVQAEFFMADFELLRDDVDQILNSGPVFEA
jgi:hypothetical protein